MRQDVERTDTARESFDAMREMHQIDRRMIGTQAARSILRKISGEDVASMVEVDFEIVRRGSA